MSIEYRQGSFSPVNQVKGHIERRKRHAAEAAESFKKLSELERDIFSKFNIEIPTDKDSIDFGYRIAATEFIDTEDLQAIVVVTIHRDGDVNVNYPPGAESRAINILGVKDGRPVDYDSFYIGDIANDGSRAGSSISLLESVSVSLASS